jgi:hypothetical protein
MHTLRHPDEVLAFVQNYSDPCITALIQQRLEELTDECTNMEELVVFVILESGDGIEQLQSDMQSQMQTRMQSDMHSQMDLQTDLGAPLWEVIEEHSTCYELVFVLSSSGYGALVFAPKAEAAPDILALCQEHAHRSPPYPPPDAIDAPVATDTAHRGGFFTPVETKEPHETSR